MKRLAILFVLLGLAETVFPDALEEIFTYEVYLSLKNGITRTYSAEEEAVLYLPKGTHFLIPVKTLRVNSGQGSGTIRPELLRNEVEGILSIDASKRSDAADFTYEIDLIEEIFTPIYGKDSLRRYEDFLKEEERYHEAVLAFMEAREVIEGKKETLGMRIARLSEQGIDTTILAAEYDSLIEPEPPIRPSREVRAPQRGFPVELETGTHRIALIDSEGFTVEGSLKTVVVFSPLRTGEVGYEVIPGNSWTRSYPSEVSGAVLYVRGKPDLYLRVHEQETYDGFRYTKMLNGAAKAVPGSRLSVAGKTRKDAVLSISSGTHSVNEVLTPFIIQQREGESLGYTILPYDPKAAEREPDFSAFLVRFSPEADRIRVDALDSTGIPLRGGAREVRSLRRESCPIWLLCVLLSPSISIPIIRVVRRRRLYEV